MKITDPKVIQSGERAFLNAVKDHLDWNAIREVVKKKMSQCSLESKGGTLVVHDNSVAFRVDVHCAMDVSIMFDRDGNWVSEEIPAAAPELGDMVRDADEERSDTASAPANSPKSDTSVLNEKSSVEMDIDSEDEDDVLELNDLLGDVPPESDILSPRRAEKSDDRDEENEDLEALFFKDNDNNGSDDDMPDEDNAFWKDK